MDFCVKEITMARMKKDVRLQKMDDAKRYYLKGITDVEELAGIVEVSTKTIYSWINKGGWEKLQKNFMLTKEEQMANMLDELSEINAAIKNKPEGERFADAKIAQIRRQLIKDLKDLENEAQLPDVISVLTRLLKFVRKIDLDKSKELSHWCDAFIKSLLKK